MLGENKRIYASILCLTGGIKYYCEAMFFDDNIIKIKTQPFELQCFISIANLLACVCLLITIVRKEVGEIMHHQPSKSHVVDDDNCRSRNLDDMDASISQSYNSHGISSS